MKRTRRVVIALAIVALAVAAPSAVHAAEGTVHLETRGFDIETAALVHVTASSSDVRVGTNQSFAHRQLLAMNGGGVTKFPPGTDFDSLTCPELRAPAYFSSIFTGSSQTQDPVVGTIYAARSVVDGYVKLRLTQIDRSAPTGLVFEFVTFACAADTTPPVITPSVTGELGSNGWYVSDVTVAWTVTDDESEIIATSGCGQTTLSGDTPETTLTCAASSAGGDRSSSVAVKIDVTAPAVSYLGNAGSYTVDQQVQITCSASDTTSAVASDSCVSVDAPAYTFDVGENSLNASATDYAGNAGSGATTFTVVVDAAGLNALIARFVSDPGIASSLQQRIDHAFDAPNENARRGMLQGFSNEVRAQSGRAISEADADVLLDLVGSL